MEGIRLRLQLLALALLIATISPGMERPAGADGPLTRVNTVALGTSAHDIVLNGNLAYVATDVGLMILDLSNPAFPVVRSSAATSGFGKSQGLAVQDGYAYLASQNAGLQVFDVSNPDAPTLVAVRKVIGAAWDVAVKDHIAYVVSFSGEMYLFDITDPTQPVRVRVIGLPAWRSPAGDAANLTKLNNYVTSGNAKATGVSIAGNHLFATDWAYGRLYYYVIDVEDPTQPVFSGTHDAPFILRAEADPANDVVYMLSASGGVSGIYTVPISALGPTYSTRHSTCGVCGYAKSNYGIDMGGLGVSPGGRYMFYAGGKVGEFHILDVTDPIHMENVASAAIGPHRVQLAQTMGLQASGDYLYFAAGATGIQVFTFPGLSD